MYEIFHPWGEIDVQGEAYLEQIRKLNESGHYVLFSANHLLPPGIRSKMMMPEDYPALDRVLQEHGIQSRVVLKGDTNVKIGDSKFKEMYYQILRSVITGAGRLLSGGITVDINIKDPDRVIASNTSQIRKMISALQADTEEEQSSHKSNLVIYPYADWYPSGTQTFDETVDLHNGEAFVGREDFQAWRKSLKDGFIRIAKLADVPLVPTYVEQDRRKEKEWSIRFGEMIAVPKDANNVEIAKQYLAAMRALRAGSSVE